VPLAIAGSACVWFAGLGIGGIHRTFVVMGAPTTAALITQASSNKFYQDNPSVEAPSDKQMSDRHLLFSLGMLGTFFLARAYSNTQGFIQRETVTVVGYADEPKPSVRV